MIIIDNPNDKKNASYYFDNNTTDRIINIPDGVERIDDYLFSTNNNIEVVNLPTTLRTIEGGSFSECQNLNKIDFPNGLQKIGISAFLKCGKIRGINLPDSLKILDAGCFCRCYSLERVIIPGSVKVIDTNAFSSCTSLKEVVMAEGIENIGYQAFKNCSSLKRINIPSTVKQIYFEAFEGCDSLKEVIVSIIPFIELKLYDNPTFKKNHVKFMITWNNKKEIEYSDKFYYSCREIMHRRDINTENYFREDISAEKRRTHFNTKDVLDSSSRATNYSIPYGVVEIGSNTFRGYYNLEEVSIPETVKIIGAGTFENCKSLKNVIFSPGLESLRNNTFEGCISLERIVMPSTLKEIGLSCFKNCTNLKEVVLNEGLIKLDSSIFYGCDSLKKITIPGSLKRVSGKWFLRDSSLEEITLGEGIISIEKNGFYSARSLKTIKLPNSLETIAKDAFAGCGLLNSIVLPENLKTIGEYAFLDCNSISNINLPHGLLEIQESAFRNTSIEELLLPITLQRTNPNVLSSISSLRKVKVVYENFQELHEFVKNNKEALYSFYLSHKNKGKTIFVGPRISKVELLRLAVQLNIEAFQFETTEPKKQEEIEETKKEKPTIVSYTNDEEIDTIINNIYSKTSFLPLSIKKIISEKINKIIEEYEKTKRELKPRLNDGINIKLQIDSPLARRLDIVSKLETILFSITDLDYYNKIFEQVDYYFELINGISIKPLENDYISVDIVDILNNTSKFPLQYNKSIKEELTTALDIFRGNIEKEIETLFDNNPLTNPTKEDFRTGLALEISKIKNKVSISLKSLRKYVNLRRALEGKMVPESEMDDITKEIQSAAQLIDLLPKGKFKYEIEKAYEDLKKECIASINQAINTNNCYTLDKYNEVVFLLLNKLEVIATRIYEYNELSKIEKQKEALTPAPVTSVNGLNALKMMLNRCILFLKGEIKDYLMLNRKGVEGEIIKFYYSVTRNQDLTEEDKKDLLNRLIKDLTEHLEKAERGECTPDNDYQINEIFKYISSLEVLILDYTSRKKNYELAFNHGDKKI